MSTLQQEDRRHGDSFNGNVAFYDTSAPNFQSIIKGHYDFEDAVLRLFRGDITLNDLEKMTKKELLERMEARIRSMKQDDGREQQARELMATIERGGV